MKKQILLVMSLFMVFITFGQSNLVDCEHYTDCNKIFNGEFDDGNYTISSTYDHHAFEENRVNGWWCLYGTPSIKSEVIYPGGIMTQGYSMYITGSTNQGESGITCTSINSNVLYLLSFDERIQSVLGSHANLHFNLSNSNYIDAYCTTVNTPQVHSAPNVENIASFSNLSNSNYSTKSVLFKTNQYRNRMYIYSENTNSASSISVVSFIRDIKVIPIEYSAQTICRSVYLSPTCWPNISLPSGYSCQWSVTSGPGIVMEGETTLTPHISVNGGSTDFLLTITNGTTTYEISVPIVYSPMAVNPVIINNSGLGNNGSITPNVTGGTLPYTYTWSNGATTASISNLASGTYSVRVRETNGCEIYRVFTITQSTLSARVSCRYGLRDQIILTATPSGGTAPYTYQWSWGDSYLMQSVVSHNNPVTINHASYLSGMVTLKVTDANGLTYSWSVPYNRLPCRNSISKDNLRRANIDSENIISSKDINIYPNPAKDKLNIEFSNIDTKIVSIVVYNNLSKELISIKNPDKNIDISKLKPGLYFIKILSSDGIVVKQFIKK